MDGRALRGVVASLVLAAAAIPAFSASPPASASPVACAMSSPPIWDTVATDVFFDHPKRRDERLGKFVVNFYQPPDGFCHQSIASAKVKGPRGYRFRFRPQQSFDLRNYNGYIDDHFMHAVWLMAFDRRGFLRNGRYTITVRFRNGEVEKATNVFQRNRPLLREYRRLRAGIAFSPSGETVPPLMPMTLRWTTLSELGGPAAYYSTRLSEPVNGFVDPHHMIAWDGVFYESYVNPDAGRDRNTIPIPPGLTRPAREYVWFTEILDSNRLQDLNLAIFQPPQFFRTS